MSDHERIWLEPAPPEGVYEDRTWCKDDVWTGEPAYDGALPTEYVRADLVAALVEAARREMWQECMDKAQSRDSPPDGYYYAGQGERIAGFQFAAARIIAAIEDCKP